MDWATLKVGQGWWSLIFALEERRVYIFLWRVNASKIENLPDAFYFVLGKVRAANALLVESKGFISLA